MKQQTLTKQEYNELIDNYITKSLIKQPATSHTIAQIQSKSKKR